MVLACLLSPNQGSDWNNKQPNETIDREAPAEENTSRPLPIPLIVQAVEHASALEDGADAETIHKIRVALHQMRPLPRAYRPVLHEKFDEEQRTLFKSLANAARRHEGLGQTD